MSPENGEAPADHVRAAGGLVWSRWGRGPVRILLVHRPRYDDWSLPKGKADRGESDSDCALREVQEETGLTCLLGSELPSTSYRDNKGRDKVVRYWTMEPMSGSFSPNAEIDEIRWLPVDEAVRLLSYDHDRPVVEAFEAPVVGGS
jgi:8-oxo-dGTP diphosphatase